MSPVVRMQNSNISRHRHHYDSSIDEERTAGMQDSGGQGGRKKVRTRSGCLNCRRKRRKCDEAKPVCKDCNRRNETCEWGVKVSFRAENAQTIRDDHPSMRRDVWNKRPRRFEILNVTSEVVRDYWNDLSLGNGSPIDLREFSPEVEEPHMEDASQTLDNTELQIISPSDTTTSQNTSFPAQEFSPYLHNSPEDYVCTGVFDARPAYSSPIVEQSFIPNRSLPQHYSSTSGRETSTTSRRVQSAAANLLLLRDPQADLRIDLGGTEPTFGSVDAGPNSMHSMSDMTPVFDDLFIDGIFEPGSTYQELHTTLRNHMFGTARSNAPTRQCSPEPAILVNYPPRPLSTTDRDTTLTLSESSTEKATSNSPSPQLTPEEEFVLWKNYIEEIASWLDKFDNKCHFAHKLPPLAESHPHLRYSILALSARQLELKDPSLSSSKSLALYQEAIHLLVPQLQTRNTAVIASCVVLCVLEMMSCSPKAWRRHLDGCASLMEAVGINGFVGGTEQALFWCFVRMDVCGGLISSEQTLIPVERWATKGSLAEDVQLFRSCPSFDMYASFAVYLLARVLRLFADYPSSRDSRSQKYAESWSELYHYIDDWYIDRPEEMLPIFYVRSDPKAEAQPFPTLLFGNAPAVSGNQLYHTAALLMLQKRPPGAKISRKTQSILWHARRICAISTSNTHHGCWTNCVQPLWIAGKVMSHPVEHQAILKIYERIERETGWSANWRANDLKEFWGNLDD